MTTKPRTAPASRAAYLSGEPTRVRRLLLIGLLALLAAGSLAVILAVDPIAQSPRYHQLADRRSWLGIPNFNDVASNLPFLLVGAWALLSRALWVADEARRAWVALFLGVALVSIGSSGYHLAPDNRTLAWDRLPMTMGFMGLLVALLSEHVDRRVEAWGLAPALIAGAGSVLYWHWSGDLRPYVWVQLAPLIAIPVVLLLFAPRYSHRGYLLLGLGCYAAAKVTENADAAIFAATGEVLSGHTLKHLLAALGPLAVYRMLVVRRRLDPEQRARGQSS